MARKRCPAYYAEIGWDDPNSSSAIPLLSRNCCDSCHEDADEGYHPLTEVDGEPDSEVCCAVALAVEAERTGKKPEAL